jgi:hypothetical protein
VNCFTFRTSQVFFPSVHKPNQRTDLSPPFSCMWHSSWTVQPLKMKALCILTERQQTPSSTSVTVFIKWTQTSSLLLFCIPYSYWLIWKPAPMSISFSPLVAYHSALKKEAAAFSTLLVNFFQTTCHRILEGSVLGHSTILYLVKVTAIFL